MSKELSGNEKIDITIFDRALLRMNNKAQAGLNGCNLVYINYNLEVFNYCYYYSMLTFYWGGTLAL